MSTDLLWFRAKRQKLPGLLVGMEAPEGQVFDSPDAASADASADFLVGYPLDGRTDAPGLSPSIVLIADSKVGDLLGWLQTYSEESFPVSQFCPIQTIGEWKLISRASRTTSGQANGRRQWAAASLIVGEMLAQSESDLNLSTVPISWSNACFTLPVVHAIGQGEPERETLTRLACERLTACEANARFPKRAVSVEVLLPIWALLTKRDVMQGPLPEICHLVVHALDPGAGAVLSQAKGLLSSSAEQRVHSFDEVADEAMRIIRAGRGQRSAATALLAAAALLVGGSTSHVELLRPTLGEVPETLAWFGLMAGFAGPEAWDRPWLRLVAGVERQLSGTSRTGEGVSGDLSWTEYEWLSGNREPNAYDGFPKKFLRMLTVEIVPGASCQFRLQPAQASKGGSRQKYQGKEATSASRPTGPMQASVDPLTQRERLVAIAEELLRLANEGAAPVPILPREQPSLFQDGADKAARRTSKSRKTPTRK